MLLAFLITLALLAVAGSLFITINFVIDSLWHRRIERNLLFGQGPSQSQTTLLAGVLPVEEGAFQQVRNIHIAAAVEEPSVGCVDLLFRTEHKPSRAMVLANSRIVSFDVCFRPIVPAEAIAFASRLTAPNHSVDVYPAEVAPRPSDRIGIAGAVHRKPAEARQKNLGPTMKDRIRRR